ncbi:MULTISPECIES: TVP38/TMEM64 family protein [Streptomyces]|uniref:TVP38/TMEM64 family protein n=1 Tax=Streptomyces TaxID=1883 RepID=UPI002B059D08|nr:TVP38/TMEM64 family protein [Streptomyces sp. JHD 1]
MLAPAPPPLPGAAAVAPPDATSTTAGRPRVRVAAALSSAWLKCALLLALLAAAVAAGLLHEPQRLVTGSWTAHLPAGTALTGFTLAYGLATAAFVPRPVLSLAAGALFGAGLGTAASLAGSVLGTAAAFGLGRLLGRDALRPLLRGRRLAAADRLLSREGFRAVLVLRMLPGVPFALSNYAAALSRLRWPAIVAGTAVGTLPSTAAYAVAGSRANDPTSPAFLAASAFLAVTGLGAVGLAWYLRARRRRAACRVPTPVTG